MFLDMIEDVKKIRLKMKVAPNRHKSYADLHRRDIEFEVGNHVLLRVSPMRGVIRFRNRGKLSLKFNGPFEILDRIGEVAHILGLPAALEKVHTVFHVSQLWKYLSDPKHEIKPNVIELD